MKKLIFFVFLAFAFHANAQTLYVPSNPDNLLLPINVNGVVRSVTVKDLHKTVDKRIDTSTTRIDSVVNALSDKVQTATTVNGHALTNNVTISKADVGLSNVDNTADLNKPISSAQQSALDLKAPIASPTFTGTVTGISKAMVGLGNVDNTTDLNKPISNAQQSALDLKAPIASPTFTGTVTGVTKAMVGLGNVDNTADLNKPISSAQQSALDLKAPIASPTFTGTVTGVTKAMVGLGNVDNTSDASKPISAAQQSALNLKVDVVANKGLTYTNIQYNTQTSSAYTLVLSDTAKTVILDNSSSITLTFPSYASVAIPVGKIIPIYQLNAGTISIAPAAGVTVNSPGGRLKTAEQYSKIYAEKIATDTWILYGDLKL